MPFVQLSAALGSPKRRNPMAPTHQIWMYPRVRVALVKLPSVPAAIRAVVVSRDRMAHFRSLVVGLWVAAAPDCVSCRCGRTFARLELFDGLYVMTEYSSLERYVQCVCNRNVRKLPYFLLVTFAPYSEPNVGDRALVFRAGLLTIEGGGLQAWFAARDPNKNNLV